MQLELVLEFQLVPFVILTGIAGIAAEIKHVHQRTAFRFTEKFN